MNIKISIGFDNLSLVGPIGAQPLERFSVVLTFEYLSCFISVFYLVFSQGGHTKHRREWNTRTVPGLLCYVQGYTGCHGTSEIEHGLCAYTVDNPLAKARGLSLRTGPQTMLYLPLV